MNSNLIRRTAALLLILSLVLAMAPASQAAKQKNTIKLKSVDVPTYVLSTDVELTMTLYFKNGGDIPYVALEEWPVFFRMVNRSYDEEYDIICKTKGNIFSYIRETKYDATFDFKKKTLYFTDKNAFFRRKNLSLTGADSISPSLQSLFKRSEASYNKYGSDVTINLKKYGIDIFTKRGIHYIPLQTLSDLFFSMGMGAYMTYNGRALFFSSSSSMPLDMLVEYQKGKKTKRSKAFARFNYGELCMALDYLYGAQESHRIKDFDSFFTNTGLSMYLTSTDDALVDEGIYYMINFYFDDLHSGFGNFSYNSSYNTDRDALTKIFKLPRGASTSAYLMKREKYENAYARYQPDGTKSYEEVGDTAYIKFDSFRYDKDVYTSVPTESETYDDCIRLMQYACDRILRDKSPIKRVVLDLSMNGGGASSTAMYVMGTFLGESAFAVRDVKTDASSHAFYNIDTNLDGEFDSRDTLAGKGLELFCIISPLTFSSANLVACRFKESGDVTLIGKQSGGGSCDVQPLCTASGTMFQVAGPHQISFDKNGSLYDVDRGAEPDVFIKDVGRLYDRVYANEVLDHIW